jgi:hypothetical protein
MQNPSQTYCAPLIHVSTNAERIYLIYRNEGCMIWVALIRQRWRG